MFILTDKTKISRLAMVKKMKKGTVIVAIDIDQGSSIETARPTSHEDPIYIDEGIIHYCVANMPGVFSRTSTVALTNLTLPYIKKIAARGLKVLEEDPEIKTGLNIRIWKVCGRVQMDKKVHQRA